MTSSLFYSPSLHTFYAHLIASGGRLSIEMLPVDSVVKYTETHDAVGAGILNGHITATGYISGKDPAFALIGNTVGAWSSPYEMLRYINYGGGKELMNELLNPYGIHMIGATSGGLEAFISTIPLNGVADLKGLKLRAPEGLVQKVFAAAGATPVNLPGSEVFTSLDKKVIDAADYTVFSANHAAGMHDIAPHPVYPGFHSMPLIEVSITKKTWDEMPVPKALKFTTGHPLIDQHYGLMKPPPFCVPSVLYLQAYTVSPKTLIFESCCCTIMWDQK